MRYTKAVAFGKKRAKKVVGLNKPFLMRFVSGPRRQRRLRLDVRSRHRLGAVQGLAHRQAAQTRQLGPRRRAQEVARRANEDEGALELC